VQRPERDTIQPAQAGSYGTKRYQDGGAISGWPAPGAQPSSSLSAVRLIASMSPCSGTHGSFSGSSS